MALARLNWLDEVSDDDDDEVALPDCIGAENELLRMVVTVSLAPPLLDESSSSLSDDSASGAVWSSAAAAEAAEWAAMVEETRAENEGCEDPSAPSEAMDPEAMRRY